MRIAIDISPISKNSTSAHKVRGVGAYINMLVSHLPAFDKKNEYIFVEDKNFPSDIDLVHYPYFDPFFLTLPNSFQKKTVVTVHDLTPILFRKHFPSGVKGTIRWFMQKRNLKKSDLIITDSNSSKKDITNLLGISQGKVKVVYLSADSDFKKLENGAWIETIRKKYNLPEQFALYVGDATWNKNLPRLIEAIKKTKYTLVFVGKVWESSSSQISDNPWNRDLKIVLKDIEGSSQFVKLGFVSTQDLAKIYNLASLLIMPSLYEGFGLPILEAMSCGCPVITSPEGSLSEVAGDAALYIDPYDSNSIKQAIEKIMEDKKLSDSLSKKSINRSAAFSLEKMILDTVKVYESL